MTSGHNGSAPHPSLPFPTANPTSSSTSTPAAPANAPAFAWHPRPPGAHADSYFAGALPPANIAHAHAQFAKRRTSGAGIGSGSTAGPTASPSVGQAVAGLWKGHTRAQSSGSTSASAGSSNFSGNAHAYSQSVSQPQQHRHNSSSDKVGEKDGYPMSKSHSTGGHPFPLSGSSKNISMSSNSVAAADAPSTLSSLSKMDGSDASAPISSGSSSVSSSSSAGSSVGAKDGSGGAARAPANAQVSAESLVKVDDKANAADNKNDKAGPDGNNGMNNKDVNAGGPAASLPHLRLGSLLPGSGPAASNGSGNSDAAPPATAPLPPASAPTSAAPASAQGKAPGLGRSSTFAGALSSLGIGLGFVTGASKAQAAQASGQAQGQGQGSGQAQGQQGGQQQAGKDGKDLVPGAGGAPPPLPPLSAGLGGSAGGHGHGRPPSPSTLTDVLLGLHATLYGGKRTPEQVGAMVEKYYEGNAVFESPLLSAHGREQIANQFIMAFSLPGLDVRSELRDVICSDFEFDGTRAGIIDQTITVTFLPWLFGDDTMSKEAADAEAAYYAGTSGFGGTSAHPGSSSAFPLDLHHAAMGAAGSSAAHGHAGASGVHSHAGGHGYGYGSHFGGMGGHSRQNSLGGGQHFHTHHAGGSGSQSYGAHHYGHGAGSSSIPGTAPVTPHPFANYSSFSRAGPGAGGAGGAADMAHGHSASGFALSHTAPHSPTANHTFGGGAERAGSNSAAQSRPHTPGWSGGNAPSGGGSGFFGVRPLSSAHPAPAQAHSYSHGHANAHHHGSYGAHPHSQTHTTASSVAGDDYDDDDDDGFGIGSSVSQRHAGSSVFHTGTAGAQPGSAYYPSSAAPSVPNTAGLGPHAGDGSHYFSTSAIAAQTPGADGHAYGDASAGGPAGEMASYRPAMPEDAIAPHWSNEGFGRRSVRSLVWGLLHPRKALKSLCSIQLRLMSRLEFNDAGMIVRHEDTWGLREAIEGVLPFASIIYPLHRRIVGTLVSLSIGKGFSLRNSMLFRKPLEIQQQHEGQHAQAVTSGESTPLARHQLAQASSGDAHAHDPHAAALALLDRTQYANPERFRTISRSRNTSPNRYRWNPEQRSYQTGTRSRARSLVGGTAASSVAGSHDNLSMWYSGHHHMHSSGSSVFDGGLQMGGGVGGGNNVGPRDRGDRELPPDSSARYRDRAARRAEGGRTTSTTSAPPSMLGDYSAAVVGAGPGTGPAGASASVDNLLLAGGNANAAGSAAAGPASLDG